MTILISGIEGQLGQALLESYSGDEEILGLNRNQFNLENFNSCRDLKFSNYDAITAKLGANKLVTTFDYITENHELGNSELLKNNTEVKFSNEHSLKSDQRYWDPYIHTSKGSKTYKRQFGPDIYNSFILDFISKHKDQPFFIYYPMTLPHGPLVHTPLDMNASTKLEKHKAMVEYIDFLTGKNQYILP